MRFSLYYFADNNGEQQANQRDRHFTQTSLPVTVRSCNSAMPASQRLPFSDFSQTDIPHVCVAIQ
jgi:hypothetical protein